MSSDMITMQEHTLKHMQRWQRNHPNASKEESEKEWISFRAKQLKRRGAPSTIAVKDSKGFSIPAGSSMDQVFSFLNTLCDGKNRNKCHNCGVADRKFQYCSRCKVTAYCGKECQKEHWKTHKKQCENKKK